jgi:hypothetical protein
MVAITRLQRARRFVIGKTFPVVVESFEQPASVAVQSRAQSLFDPCGGGDAASGAQPRFDFREEGFGFLTSFPAGLVAEFFLAVRLSSGGSVLWRCARLRVTASSIKAAASSVKRRWLASCSSSAGTSAAGTRRLALRPFSQT